MQTEDIEQKKLVYLYLINYAKTQPDLVILVVNTFVKDSDDQNFLIRALTIRTMGFICVENIVDYLFGPLQKYLHDETPYVRKTAALCVAKLYDLKPELVLENGFLEQLREMISDSNRNGAYVPPSCSRRHLIPLEGCREHRSALSDIHTSATSQPSTSSLDPAIFTVTQTILNKLHRAQRMLRVGPRRYTVCVGTVSGARQEGKRA
jgi:AP-1 complex subunit beta-1